MSFLCWGFQGWMQDSRWGLTRAEQKGRIPSLDWLAMFPLMQPRVRLAFWTVSTHCWLMSSFSSTGTHKSFLAELLSITLAPSLYWYLGLPWPMCRTLHLILLNLMRFTQAHFLSLSKSLWMVFQPSSLLTAPLSLMSSANLLKVHSIPLSMSRMKILTSTGPSNDPWGTPLVTSLHLDIAPLTTSLWMQPSKQFPIHWTVHPSNPPLSDLERRMLWGTVSKALQKCR